MCKPMSQRKGIAKTCCINIAGNPDTTYDRKRISNVHGLSPYPTPIAVHEPLRYAVGARRMCRGWLLPRPEHSLDGPHRRDCASVSPYRYADAKHFSISRQFPLTVDIPRAKWMSPPRQGISPPPSQSARWGGTRRAPTADHDWKRSFCSRTGRCWDQDLVRR